MGAALAASVLLRPEQALLTVAVVPAVALLWLRDGQGWDGGNGPGLRAEGGAGAVRGAAAGAVGDARNWRTFHVVQPLAPHYATDPGEPVPLGFQRWYRSWAIDFATTEEVYWSYDGSPIQLTDLPGRAFDSRRRSGRRRRRCWTTTTRRRRRTAAFDARFEALARERRVGHWWRYMGVAAGGAAGEYAAAAADGVDEHPASVVGLAEQCGTGCVCVLLCGAQSGIPGGRSCGLVALAAAGDGRWMGLALGDGGICAAAVCAAADAR